MSQFDGILNPMTGNMRLRESGWRVGFSFHLAALARVDHDQIRPNLRPSGVSRQ